MEITVTHITPTYTDLKVEHTGTTIEMAMVGDEELAKLIAHLKQVVRELED